MTYKYTAYTIDKKIVQGKLDASTESLAEEALYRAGYQRILSLEEMPPAVTVESLIPSLFGVKQQEVIEFSGQLATLISSGVALLTALRLLRSQKQKKALLGIIDELIKTIESGNPLSDGLARYPQVFSETFCQVIQASEQSGTLDEGLRQAAGYIDRQMKALQKARRAMMYPLFVLLVAAGVTVLLVTVALPPLIQLFTSLDAELPIMTRIVISLTEFVKANVLVLLAVLIGITAAVMLVLRIESVKRSRDGLLLTLPIIGSLIIERSMQQLCRTTAMLMGAGLRLPTIMEIIIKTESNRVLREALVAVRDGLVQGEGLSQPMTGNPLFPKLMVEMIVVGEQTGTLDAALNTLGDFYDRKVERKIDTLITMIEPVVTFIVGLIVIFIALSMILPLYSILRTMT